MAVNLKEFLKYVRETSADAMLFDYDREEALEKILARTQEVEKELFGVWENQKAKQK